MPIRIPLPDPVDFLLHRKFPDFKALQHPLSLTGRPHVSYEERQKRLTEIEAYEAKLLAMSEEELQELYKQELEKVRHEAQAKADHEEQQKFFNQPYAKADFIYWSKATYWTLDEAVALSFGKAPEVVTWKKVEPYVQVSAFAVQFSRVRELAMRAKVWHQLYDQVLPGFFLAWAKRNEISYPPELEEQVTARGQQITDWKDAYDRLKAQHDEYAKAARTLIAKNDASLTQLAGERDALRTRVVQLEQAIQDAPAKEKPLLTKERDSVLKLLIGIAIKGYGYDPNATRNDATGEIAGDLSLLGIPLDPDTVRKWLKEGAELLSPESMKKP